MKSTIILEPGDKATYKGEVVEIVSGPDEDNDYSLQDSGGNAGYASADDVAPVLPPALTQDELSGLVPGTKIIVRSKDNRAVFFEREFLSTNSNSNRFEVLNSLGGLDILSFSNWEFALVEVPNVLPTEPGLYVADDPAYSNDGLQSRVIFQLNGLVWSAYPVIYNNSEAVVRELQSKYNRGIKLVKLVKETD